MNMAIQLVRTFNTGTDKFENTQEFRMYLYNLNFFAKVGELNRALVLRGPQGYKAGPLNENLQMMGPSTFTWTQEFKDTNNLNAYLTVWEEAGYIGNAPTGNWNVNPEVTAYFTSLGWTTSFELVQTND